MTFAFYIPTFWNTFSNRFSILSPSHLNIISSFFFYSFFNIFFNLSLFIPTQSQQCYCCCHHHVATTALQTHINHHHHQSPYPRQPTRQPPTTSTTSVTKPNHSHIHTHLTHHHYKKRKKKPSPQLNYLKPQPISHYHAISTINNTNTTHTQINSTKKMSKTTYNQNPSLKTS